MKTQKNNLGLALSLSMLIALGGAVVFGIVYAIGYYIYLLAIMEIILACTVFLLYKPATKWTIVVFAIVWSFVWAFAFNIMSVVVCEAIAVADELNVSLSQGIKLVMDYWKNNAEVAAYMNGRVGQILAMIFLGGAVYGGYYIANIIKAKRVAQQGTTKTTQSIATEAKSVGEEEKVATSNNVYTDIYEACRKVVQEYQKDKNVAVFNENVAKLKTQYVAKLNDIEKSMIKTKLEKKMATEGITIEDKNIVKILLAIIK